jgi:hypothetical protein
MRRRFTLVALVVLGLSGVLAARAVFVLDQGALPADGPPLFVHVVGGQDPQVLSQTVTARVSGRLWAVNVPIACLDGQLILEIRDVSDGGQPGPTLLSSTTFRGGQLPGGPLTGEYRSLKVRGRPVELMAGEKFTISLGNPTGNCAVWPTSGLDVDPDPYPHGTGWAENATHPEWDPVLLSIGEPAFQRDDIPFQMIVQVR